MSPFPFFPLAVLIGACRGFSIPSHAPAGNGARLLSDCLLSSVLSSSAADAPQLFADCLFGCPPLATLALRPGKGRFELRRGGDAVSAGRARGERDGEAVGSGVGERGQEQEIRRTGRERREKAGGKGKWLPRPGRLRRMQGKLRSHLGICFSHVWIARILAASPSAQSEPAPGGGRAELGWRRVAAWGEPAWARGPGQWGVSGCPGGEQAELGPRGSRGGGGRSRGGVRRWAPAGRNRVQKQIRGWKRRKLKGKLM